MDSDGLEGFDYTQPLHFALSQFNQAHRVVVEEEDQTSHFPKPSSLSAMADEEDDSPAPTTMEIIDDLVDCQDDYPKTVKIMMRRGLLKKRQNCRKCGKQMNLRRRKNAYEWRCRSREKRGDCSSSSIKLGSWYEYTKHSFKLMLNFLIMHSKKCSINHMSEQLKLSVHTVNEICRFAHELSDRIQSNYPKLGKNKQKVVMEIISIKAKKTLGPIYHVLAAQELDSSLCFAEVLPDLRDDTIEAIKNDRIEEDAEITVVRTTQEESEYVREDIKYFDESKHYSLKNQRLFSIIRTEHPDYMFYNKCVQSWINEQVVRKTEGRELLERFFEELMHFTA